MVVKTILLRVLVYVFAAGFGRTLLTRLVHTKASIKFTGKRFKSNTIPVLLAYRVMHATSKFLDQDKLLIP